MILSFRTDRFGQIVQTQIRLLLEEQSDQGLHCLQFRLHLFDALLCGNYSKHSTLNKEIFKRSMYYLGPLIWDSLPVEIRQAESICSFLLRCVKWMKGTQN